MSDSDNKLLKHVYEVYKACDGSIHVEKLPVVYQNSKYIYFKHSGSYELKHIGVDYLLESVEDINYSDFESNGSFFSYCRKYIKYYDNSKDRDFLISKLKDNPTKVIKERIRDLKSRITFKVSELNVLNNDLKILESNLSKLELE